MTTTKKNSFIDNLTAKVRNLFGSIPGQDKIIAPIPDYKSLADPQTAYMVKRDELLQEQAKQPQPPFEEKTLEYPDWMAYKPASEQEIQNAFAGYNQVKPQGDILKTVLSAAEKFKINPSILASILWTESGYNPKTYNAGDRGIAQINTQWHPDVTDEQAYDPNFAIPWAAEYLAKQIASFGDINRAIASYNVGTGGASVKGPAKFGGGPKGQYYLNKVGRNLSEELRKELGILSE